MASRTLRRSDSGFALIEVIVSAAVLAIVAMAVLSGIDAATSSSAREKARAVAASLAEKDQERLRSQTVKELDALAALGAGGNVTTQPVDGVEYTVTSKAEWITDDKGGTPACGNSSKNSEYFHVTTTVESAIVGPNVPPVVIDSLVAPSAEYSSTHGVLGVKVTNRDAIPLSGVRVDISNASPAYAATQNTDEKGCALFRQVPIGTYTITLTAGGYVGTDLESPSVAKQKVSPGVVAFKTVELDVALKASITVQTNAPKNAARLVNSAATRMSVTHPKRIGLVKTKTVSGNPIEFGNLFPFKSGDYSFFTGTCSFQSPSTYDANYFTNNPGKLVVDITKPTQSIFVRQPPLNLRITRNYGQNTFSTSNLKIYAKLDKQENDDCGEDKVELTFMNWPTPTTGPWGPQPTGTKTGASGWVTQTGGTYDPGLPFGDYTICVHDSRPTTDRYQTIPYENRTPGGVTNTVDNADYGWTTTPCV